MTRRCANWTPLHHGQTTRLERYEAMTTALDSLRGRIAVVTGGVRAMQSEATAKAVRNRHAHACPWPAGSAVLRARESGRVDQAVDAQREGVRQAARTGYDTQAGRRRAERAGGEFVRRHPV